MRIVKESRVNRAQTNLRGKYKKDKRGVVSRFTPVIGSLIFSIFRVIDNLLMASCNIGLLYDTSYLGVSDLT
jgi:hypothetical protein